MDHAGYREQARQLLRRVTVERAGMQPGAAPRASRRRRQLLGALGWIGLASVTLRTFARAVVAQPSSAVNDDNHLEVALGLLGPRLIAAGVIDPSRFSEACARAGEPLDATRLQILETGSDTMIAFDSSSGHFLLNLFWAAGLANANPILTLGPMAQNGLSRISGYASTGSWTLAPRPVMDVYARVPLISLTADQQSRLEEVTSNVFRPCCDNPTSFPDCNHGMAMLGLLTLVAVDDRDADAMFLAAKAANRFWFPQQSGQLASYVQASRGVEYARLDAREASSRMLFSGSGFRNVASWLSEHGLTAPGNGPRCAA
jgi:hypothetical protein